MQKKGTIERAFEIAKEGKCTELKAIRRQLKLEGYDAIDSHLSGFLIKKQLQAIIKT